jgi:hypothetical protein
VRLSDLPLGLRQSDVERLNATRDAGELSLDAVVLVVIRLDRATAHRFADQLAVALPRADSRFAQPFGLASRHAPPRRTAAFRANPHG